MKRKSVKQSLTRLLDQQQAIVPGKARQIGDISDVAHQYRLYLVFREAISAVARVWRQSEQE